MNTQEVLDRHTSCFGDGDLEGFLADYAPDCIMPAHRRPWPFEALRIASAAASGEPAMRSPSTTTGPRPFTERPRPAPSDLLITDITMLDIHGPRLANMLHQSQPGLFVVLISGHARGAVPTGGDGAPVDFLPKPFRPAELAKEAITFKRSQGEPIDDRI